MIIICICIVALFYYYMLQYIVEIQYGIEIQFCMQHNASNLYHAQLVLACYAYNNWFYRVPTVAL